LGHDVEERLRAAQALNAGRARNATHRHTLGLLAMLSALRAGEDRKTRCLNLGTLTGASAVAMCGSEWCHVTSVDIDPACTAHAAQLDPDCAVDWQTSDATLWLRGPGIEPKSLDLVFVDANKRGTSEQLELLLSPHAPSAALMSKGGIVVVDDVALTESSSGDAHPARRKAIQGMQEAVQWVHGNCQSEAFGLLPVGEPSDGDADATVLLIQDRR
jgi:predicted O-methyltransferase YrrM